MGSIARANDGPEGRPLRPTQRGSRKRSRDASGEFDDIRRAIQAMETTFITIHDLTRDANILYCSQSVAAVLDWQPEEVIGRPCWEFFHPDEVSFAKTIHGRGVELDKASVLNYCRIKNRYGQWIGCECVFTIVHDVLIGCTSIYLDGPKAKKRAVEAPVVRQLFSSSPRDPRYHMLTYISFKFNQGPQTHIHEPRAALFLNRFTLTLTINFATNGLEDLLDISADELQGKSFYYCIQSYCLKEAVRCLESAKANDSIAYLRFWYRDPRLEGNVWHDGVIRHSGGGANDEDNNRNSSGSSSHSDIEEHIDGNAQDSGSDSKNEALDGESGSGLRIDDFNQVRYDDDDDDYDDDEEDGGVSIDAKETTRLGLKPPKQSNGTLGRRPQLSHSRSLPSESLTPDSGEGSRKSSRQNTDAGRDAMNRLFDRSPSRRSSTPRTAVSTDSPVPDTSRHGGTSDARNRDDSLPNNRQPQRFDGEPPPYSKSMIELEAVISCTSDGLVVIIREARPFVPSSVRVPPHPGGVSHSHGLFASPWAMQPILPDPSALPSAALPGNTYASSTVAPGSSGQASQASSAGLSGPPLPDFMKTIREVAVFAWALTGINGSLQKFGRGKPLMGAIPHSGLPVWDPTGGHATDGEHRSRGEHRDSGKPNSSRGLDGDGYDAID